MLDRLKKLPRLVQILIAFVLVIGATAFLGALMRPAPHAQTTEAELPPEPESNLVEGEQPATPAPSTRPGPRPGPPSAPTADAGTVAAPVRRELRRPAAFPSDHPMQPGGIETYFTNSSGRSWNRIGERRLESGMPLAAIDTQAASNAGVRGWAASMSRRIARSGLFLVEQEGTHTFVLDGTVPGWQSGMAHGQACRVAVGDESSVILDGREGAAGAATLAAGWHWVYFDCEPRHQELIADVAVVGPSSGGADLIALYMPADRDAEATSGDAEIEASEQPGDDAPDEGDA